MPASQGRSFGPYETQALEQGSFRRFRRSCDRLDDAFDLFADWQRRRYRLPAAAAESCCGCGGTNEVRVAQADWDFRFPSIAASVREVALAAGHAYHDRHRHGRFTTYHAACDRCWRLWWGWRIAGSTIMVPGAMAVSFGSAVTILASVFFVGGTFRPSERAQLPYGIAGGVVLMLTGIALWVLGQRWRIPAPLRCVAHRPITLEKMQRHAPQDLQRYLAWEAEEDEEDQDDDDDGHG